jgi:hypothetical protein
MTFHGPDTISGDREMVVRGDNTMYSNMQRGQKVVLYGCGNVSRFKQCPLRARENPILAGHYSES